MTTHQRTLRIIGLTLAILAVVFLAGQTAFGLGIAVLLAGIEEGGESAAALSAEEVDVLRQCLDLIPGLFFVTVLQVIAGFMGSGAAKHPAKAKRFTVFALVVLVVNVASGVYYSTTGGFDAASVAVSMVPAMLVILCLVCSHNVAQGFQDGSVKDIAQIKGESYKADLGFIRFIQVLFLLNVCFTLVGCTMVASSSFTFSFSTVLDFTNLVLDGVGFWLIFQRSKAARYWIIGISALNIVANLVYLVATGGVDVTTQIVSFVWDAFLILYFALAKRPREALNRTFDARYRKELKLHAWDIWQPKSWDFWRNMIIYFCLFSIVGHWMEAGLCLFIKYGIVPGIYDPNSGIWRDYLSPFPVYGAGMVACGLLLYPIKTKLEEKLGGVWKPLLVSFLVNTLVCAVIELILGFTSNQPVNGVYPLWDYSTMPFNFMGQICLQNTTAFGVVATLMTWAVWPALQNISAKMPNDIRRAFFVAVVVFYALVCCLYLIKLV